MPRTRRVKGGIPRDVAEALHEAEQKGIEDAKKPFYKTFRTPPGIRINEVARILTRKYPRVAEGQIREKFVEGFTNTRRPTTGGRRKTRKVKRGGVSPSMMRALEAAATEGKTDKEAGTPSRAEQAADDIISEFGVGAITNARTLIRDKYAASYAEASQSRYSTQMQNWFR